MRCLGSSVPRVSNERERERQRGWVQFHTHTHTPLHCLDVKARRKEGGGGGLRGVVLCCVMVLCCVVFNKFIKVKFAHYLVRIKNAYIFMPETSWDNLTSF